MTNEKIHGLLVRRIPLLAHLIAYQLTTARQRRLSLVRSFLWVVQGVGMWVKLEALGMSGARVPYYSDRLDLLETAARAAPREGLWLEFGVYRGESINRLARATAETVFGFDSFEGLPWDWTFFARAGTFNTRGQLPAVEPNVTLVRGWFAESLPAFLRSREWFLVSFLHVDCDLYRSVKTVLVQLEPRIHAGTIIVFDDFARLYPDDEARAFREFLHDSGHRFRYIGCSSTGSVAVRISS